MNPTSISWVRGPDGAQGFSWNPFAGCSPNKVSPGCAHCYAERLAATRLAHLPAYKGLTEEEMLDSKTYVPHWSGEVRFFPDKLAEPLRRKKPSGIFVGDMGDIALLPFEQVASIWKTMAACPQHRFYVLTKRPKLLAEALRKLGSPFWSGFNKQSHLPLPNVWIGASASTQADLDRVAPELLRIPAAVRFLSLEPLLENLDLFPFLPSRPGRNRPFPGGASSAAEADSLRGVDWVITGCESGPNARPMDPEWAESILKQCQAAGVPWFFKQAMYRGKLDHNPPMWGTTWQQTPEARPPRAGQGAEDMAGD